MDPCALRLGPALTTMLICCLACDGFSSVWAQNKFVICSTL